MSSAQKHSTEKKQNELWTEIICALLFTTGVFSTISLVFYSSATDKKLQDAMGNVGVYISSILGGNFGVCAFFIPIVMFYISYLLFTNKEKSKSEIAKKSVGGILTLLISTILVGLIFDSDQFFGYNPAGGFIGKSLSNYLKNNLTGTIGSYLIVTLAMLVSLTLLTGAKISDFLHKFRQIMKSLYQQTFKLYNGVVETLHYILYSENTTENTELENSLEVFREKDPAFPYDLQEDEKEYQKPKESKTVDPEIVVDLPAPDPISTNKVINLPIKKDFKPPPIELLDKKASKNFTIDKEEIYRKARLIEEKLRDFGVTGKVTEVRPGPVITMFEYKPSPGIKINKIASLENDLAMGLSALSIRIIAPIPGKDVIGIEVPNPVKETVVLRELIENEEFLNNPSLLTLALGKDISGKPYYMDLKTAPHLMIAGTTGSGKSVLLNALLTSLFYKASPREVKFIMIDPKMLELSIYEDIPYLLHPVVTDPKKAAAALRWAVEEMEARYKMLSEEGVRDIESFNKKLEKLDPEERDERWLPYIIIVIDELADLMMVAPNEIKESITRLSQKARAAGIHLIVATQRPSADVVAGLLKANFPARISFLVSSKIDSRIILDTGGAERLLGKGDMLFLKPGTSSLVRIQGALISDKEREAVTEYLKSQGTPVYIEEITKTDESDNLDSLEDEKDELYYTALRIVAESGQASISMLQRRLKIGYNRAARIVEIMEREGLIGPQESAGKQREVYIDISQIEELQ